jgi:hypothetical protein
VESIWKITWALVLKWVSSRPFPLCHPVGSQTTVVFFKFHSTGGRSTSHFTRSKPSKLKTQRHETAGRLSGPWVWWGGCLFFPFLHLEQLWFSWFLSQRLKKPFLLSKGKNIGETTLLHCFDDLGRLTPSLLWTPLWMKGSPGLAPCLLSHPAHHLLFRGAASHQRLKSWSPSFFPATVWCVLPHVVALEVVWSFRNGSYWK